MKKNQAKSKSLEKFLNGIVKLEPIEFIGISKILCIPLVDNNKDPRPFENVLEDMIDKFLDINHNTRKEILKIITQAGKLKVS